MRPGGNPPTLSERASPGAGSRRSSDSPSPRTPTPPSCREAARRYGGRWSLCEGAGSRRSFCRRRILTGLSAPAGCFGEPRRFKRAQGQQKGHAVCRFKWHDGNIGEHMRSEIDRRGPIPTSSSRTRRDLLQERRTTQETSPACKAAMIRLFVSFNIRSINNLRNIFTR